MRSSAQSLALEVELPIAGGEIRRNTRDTVPARSCRHCGGGEDEAALVKRGCRRPFPPVASALRLLLLPQRQAWSPVPAARRCLFSVSLRFGVAERLDLAVGRNEADHLVVQEGAGRV